MPRKIQNIANRKGLPTARPTLSAHLAQLKSGSKPCPDLEALRNCLEPGDCDPHDIYHFTGYLESVMIAYDNIQKVYITRSDGAAVFGLVDTTYIFEKDTPLSIYGFLGLSSSSDMVIVARLIEFVAPAPTEPDFLEICDTQTTFENDPASDDQNAQHCDAAAHTEAVPTALSGKPSPSNSLQTPGTVAGTDGPTALSGKPSPSNSLQTPGTVAGTDGPTALSGKQSSNRARNPGTTVRTEAGPTALSGKPSPSNSLQTPGTTVRTEAGPTALSGKPSPSNSLQTPGTVAGTDGPIALSVPKREPSLSYLMEQMEIMQKDGEITKKLNLVHFELLAAKILKRVVHKDLARGESFLYRHLEEPKRARVAAVVVQQGYDYTDFSTLADEITSTRHSKAHFNNAKLFLEAVNGAKMDFEHLYQHQLHEGGYGKTKEYFTCIRDIFDMYHLLEKLFA